MDEEDPPLPGPDDRGPADRHVRARSATCLTPAILVATVSKDILYCYIYQAPLRTVTMSFSLYASIRLGREITANSLSQPKGSLLTLLFPMILLFRRHDPSTRVYFDQLFATFLVASIFCCWFFSFFR